jgi:hypothetical protein
LAIPQVFLGLRATSDGRAPKAPFLSEIQRQPFGGLGEGQRSRGAWIPAAAWRIARAAMIASSSMRAGDRDHLDLGHQPQLSVKLVAPHPSPSRKARNSRSFVALCHGASWRTVEFYRHDMVDVGVKMHVWRLYGTACQPVQRDL